MTSDKNIMINPSLFIKTERGVDNTRLSFVQSRLASLVRDEIPVEQNILEVLVAKNHIRLRSQHLDERASIGISFHEGAVNHRRLYGGGKSQQLAKAVGVDQKKGLKVIDATAGLAGDSFVLASLGADVQMLERSPILALMIEEALNEVKGLDSPDADLMDIVSRMSVIQTDAIDWLSGQLQEPLKGALHKQVQGQARRQCEVIFLDLMFPERKKKAAVKKEMQILQSLFLETEISDQQRLKEEAELLNIALEKAVFRVVVKRPRYAPPISGQKPNYCIEGKSTRFDIYAIKKIE